MGRRGPPPRLKVIAGSVKPAARSGVFPPGTPEKPAWLSRSAGEEWKRIVPELESAGMLSLVDRAALAAYCQAWAELVETTKLVEAAGRIYEEPIQSAAGEIVGVKIKAHPAVRLQRDAFNRVKQFIVEFGLSPASRSRMGSSSGATGSAGAAADRLTGIQQRVQTARQEGGKANAKGG